MAKGKKIGRPSASHVADLDNMLDQIMNPSRNDAAVDCSFVELVRGECGVELELEDGALLFAAQIDDAYHFRNLFEYLRVVNIDANIYCKQDSIEYVYSNGIETLLNKFQIRTADIPYHFNSVYSEVMVGLNLGLFARTTKNIGKKDAFKFFMKKGINKVFYEIVSMTNSGIATQGTGSVDTREVEEFSHLLPQNMNRTPVQSIPICVFCHNCSILANLRCNKIKITAYERGVKFEGIDSYNQIQNIQRFYPAKIELIDTLEDKNSISLQVTKNAVDAPVGNVVQILQVSMLTIKWLSKLANVSQHNDRIRIYAAKDEPIRFEGNVGNYGTFEIYLKNDSSV